MKRKNNDEIRQIGKEPDGRFSQDPPPPEYGKHGVRARQVGRGLSLTLLCIQDLGEFRRVLMLKRVPASYAPEAAGTRGSSLKG